MVAPLIAAALTPFVKDLFANGLTMLGNAVMAKGKEKVEDALGVKLPPSGESISPEKLAELRALEFEHEEKLLELGIRQQELDIEAEKAYLADINSARDLGKTLSSSESALNRNIVAILAIGSVAGGISMILLSAQSDVRMAGLSICMMPLAYYFGTSQGSKQKQEQLNRIIGSGK